MQELANTLESSPGVLAVGFEGEAESYLRVEFATKARYDEWEFAIAQLTHFGIQAVPSSLTLIVMDD